MPTKPATAKKPDIVSVLVPDMFATLHVNPETGLMHAEVDTRHTAIRAVTGAGFVMSVTTVMGRLPGPAAVD